MQPTYLKMYIFTFNKYSIPILNIPQPNLFIYNKPKTGKMWNNSFLLQFNAAFLPQYITFFY